MNAVFWDQDDDPSGNHQHIADNDITMEEVEEVIANPIDEDVSRTSGRPILFGVTQRGRTIAVVFERIDEIDAVRPITAFVVPPRKQQ